MAPRKSKKPHGEILIVSAAERRVTIAAGYVAVARADIARLRENGSCTAAAWETLDAKRDELSAALLSLGCGVWRPF